MSLTRYRYFTAVADLRSVREAADMLRVAPSAISRQIASLEDEYGAVLFERQARGMALTPAGSAVLESARRMLDSQQSARVAIEELQGIRRGLVRVWTAEGAIDNLIYPALSAFSKDHPAVTFEVMTASSDQLVQRLLDDEADVAAIFYPPFHRNVTSLAEIADPIVVASHPEAGFGRTTALGIGDLGDVPLALPDETFGLRHLVEDVAAASGIELKPALVTNSIESLRAFARTGMGVSIITTLSVGRDVAAGQLAVTPMKERELRMACVKVCVRKDRRLPPAVKVIAKQLVRSGRNVTQANRSPRSSA